MALVSRRAFVWGTTGFVGLAGLATCGAYLAGFGDVGALFDGVASPKIGIGLPGDKPPNVAVGDQRVGERYSPARGRTVTYWTAVPAGHGNGAGLPVVYVLHGEDSHPGDFPSLGLAKFLTAAVASGAPPFALAGADAGDSGWRANGADDPLRMLHEDLPRWAADSGFRTRRVTLWGWSSGATGALLAAGTFAGWAATVAAVSPVIKPGDDVYQVLNQLARTRIGLWCGNQDKYLPAVRDFAAALPKPPAVLSNTLGAHSRPYWNRATPAALDFCAR